MTQPSGTLTAHRAETTPPGNAVSAAALLGALSHVAVTWNLRINVTISTAQLGSKPQFLVATFSLRLELPAIRSAACL